MIIVKRSDVIDKNYVGAVDHEKITDSSVQGMLWTLDPHSTFFSKDEFRKASGGTGFAILRYRSFDPAAPRRRLCSIDRSEYAGRQSGTSIRRSILTIDGKDARDWTSSEVSKNVRGEKGTTVKIKVERVGSPVADRILRSFAAVCRFPRYGTISCCRTALAMSV